MVDTNETRVFDELSGPRVAVKHSIHIYTAAERSKTVLTTSQMRMYTNCGLSAYAIVVVMGMFVVDNSRERAVHTHTHAYEATKCHI